VVYPQMILKICNFFYIFLSSLLTMIHFSVDTIFSVYFGFFLTEGQCNYFATAKMNFRINSSSNFRELPFFYS